MRRRSVFVDPVEQERCTYRKLWACITKEPSLLVKRRQHHPAASPFAAVDRQLHRFDNGVELDSVCGEQHVCRVGRRRGTVNSQTWKKAATSADIARDSSPRWALVLRRSSGMLLDLCPSTSRPAFGI